MSHFPFIINFLNIHILFTYKRQVRRSVTLNTWWIVLCHGAAHVSLNILFFSSVDLQRVWACWLSLRQYTVKWIYVLCKLFPASHGGMSTFLTSDQLASCGSCDNCVI